MAKKKQKPAPSRSSRKKIIWVVVAGVLLVLVCFFGIRAFVHHQQTEATYQRDKVRFAATEKDMDAAYAAIVKTVGKPYETKKTKGCGYGALKYARGPLSCGIGYTFSYGTRNWAESKRIGAEVLSNVDGRYGFSKGHVSYGISDISQSSGQYIDYVDDMHGLSCSLYHTPYTKEQYNSFGKDIAKLKLTMNAPYVSMITLRCNRDTPKALYEIDKSTE